MPRDVFGEAMTSYLKPAARKKGPVLTPRGYRGTPVTAGQPATATAEPSVSAAVAPPPGRLDVSRGRPSAAARPLNMAQFTAPVGGRRDHDAAQLDQFTKAGAMLEGSQYLADTAGMRAPGTLVTPKGLTPAAVADVVSGRTPNLTRQNMGRTPLLSAMNPAPGGYANVKRGGGGLRLRGLEDQPSVASAIGGQQAAPAAPREPAYFNPKSPVYSPEQLAESAQRGYDASLEVERRSTRGTTAIPDMERRIDIAGNPVPGLRGNSQASAGRTLVGGALVKDEDVAKRQAYLDKPEARQASIQEAIADRGQARGQARRQRIENRQRGPSVADALIGRIAQQDPAAAAQLLGLHNTRAAQLAGETEDRKLRRELGLGQLDVERERNRAELGQSGDQRQAAQVEGLRTIIDSPESTPQAKRQAQEQLQQIVAGLSGPGSAGAPAVPGAVQVPAQGLAQPPAAAPPQGATSGLETLPPGSEDRIRALVANGSATDVRNALRSAGLSNEQINLALRELYGEDGTSLGGLYPRYFEKSAEFPEGHSGVVIDPQTGEALQSGNATNSLMDWVGSWFSAQTPEQKLQSARRARRSLRERQAQPSVGSAVGAR